jgi:hypothetical protein
VIITTLPENRLVSAILTGPLQLLNKYQVIIIIINSLFQEGSKVNSKKLISPVALKKQYISTKVNIKLHIQDIA